MAFRLVAAVIFGAMVWRLRKLDRKPDGSKSNDGKSMKEIATYLFWVFIIYLVYCIIVFLAQRKLMFPRHLIQNAQVAIRPDLSIEKLWVQTTQGKVESWFMAPQNSNTSGPSPAVIFAHGNGELIDFWPNELSWFPENGIGLMLVEYPGYGRSQGSPSQKSIAEVSLAAYDTLVTRDDVHSEQIILFGRSIGGGAVCDLAARRPSAAIILMSTFTSIRFFARTFLAPGFLVLDTYDNHSVVENYSNPVLVIHGTQDETVPFRHGKALSKAAENGRLISYECGHNDCPPDWEIFWRDMSSFLSDAHIRNQLSKK